MKISDIKSLTLNSLADLSDRELKAAIKSARDAINKRINRMEQAGLVSPTAEQYRTQGTKGVAGLSREELEEELKRQIGVIKSPEGSLKVYKTIMDRTQKKLERQGIQASTEEVEDAYRRWERAVEKGYVTEDVKYEFYNLVNEYQKKIAAGKVKRMPSLKRLADTAYRRSQQGMETRGKGAVKRNGLSAYIPTGER